MDRSFVKDVVGGPEQNRTTDIRIFNPQLEWGFLTSIYGAGSSSKGIVGSIFQFTIH